MGDGGGGGMEEAPPGVADLRALVSSKEFAVLLFGAPWSVPSKMLKQKLEQSAIEYGDDVTLIFVDADEKSSLADAYEVSDIPSAVLCRGGTVAKKLPNCSAAE